MRKLFLFLMLFSATNAFSQDDLAGLTFCLDPGHGDYPNDKPYETRINLPVAKFLKTYLEAYGARVILTRQDSLTDLSLHQREEIANSNNVDFFQSIHHNAFNGNANYSLMLYEEKSNGQPEWPGESDVMSNIMVSYLHNYIYTTGEYARGDRSFLGFNLGVLNDLIMPGVLSEASFWDYVPEVHRLNSLAYLKLEAFALLHSYLDYYEVPKRIESFVEGVVKDTDGNNIPGVTVKITNDVDEMIYITDSQNIGVTAQDNSWGGFPYTTEVRNGMFFFENFPAGPAQIILERPEFNRETIAINISDSTSTRIAPVTMVSNAPARVEFIYPTPAEQQNVKVNSLLGFEFSKPMNRASLIESFSIQPQPDSIWFGFFSDDTKFAMYHQPDFEFWTEYTITIDGDVATDKWGYHPDGDGDGEYGGMFSASFRTRSVDTEPPVILKTYPAADSVGIPPETAICIEFDEPLDSSTVKAASVLLTRAENPVESQISYLELKDRSYIFIMPDTAFYFNTRYTITITTGLSDIYDNNLRSPISWQFKTTNVAYEVTDIEKYESGIGNWWDPDASGSTLGTVPAATTIASSADKAFTMLGSTRSAQLNYEWNTAAPRHLLRMYLSGGQPRNVLFSTDYKLQAFIYGDGSGNPFRFCIDELNPASHEVSEWIPIDWVGWRRVQWDLTGGTTPGRWIGDGNISGQLRFDSFQLGYNGNSENAAGTIYFDNLRLIKETGVNVKYKDTPGIPDNFVLYQNFPNPFNSSTIIPYRIFKRVKKISLHIYNSLGQELKKFKNLNVLPGAYQVTWDGCDRSQQPVSSGIYYYELRVENNVSTKRMIYVK